MRWIILVLLLFSCFSVPAEDAGEVLTIVYNKGIAPIKFSDTDGNPSGIVNDYWKMLAEKSEFEFKFIEVDTFGESLELVKSGQVDIHGGLYYTEERSEFLDYSEPILQLKSYIYSSSDLLPPESLDQVRGLILGTVQGGFTENEIKKILPEERIIIYDDFESMFRAALVGDIKVFISSDIHLSYFLSVNNLENPFSHGEQFLFEQTYFGAVPKGNSELIGKIRTIQNGVSVYDLIALKARWLHYKAFAAGVTNLVSLSEDEISWIDDNPEISLGSDFNWPPYDFIDSDGRHSGVSAGIMELIEQKTGLIINIESGIWSEILDKVRRKELDGLACAVPTEGREEYLSFSPPYFTSPTAIISRDDFESISGLEDLIGKTIAVNRNSYIHEWLKTSHPEMELIVLQSNKECLEAVSYNEADAYIANLASADHIIRQGLLTNLKVYSQVPGLITEMSVAIDSDQPVLQKIINKVLKSISYEEKRKLLEKWSSESGGKRIILSGDEVSWLKNNPLLYIAGDPHWAPMSYFDKNDNYSGFIPELMTLIEEKSGLDFEYVPVNSWRESMVLMENGELDIIDGIVASDEREEILDFSDVYFKMDIVMITRDDTGLIRSLDDIGSRTTGTVRDYITETYLKRDYPQIRPFLYDTTSEGLKAVSNGSIDIFITDIPTFEYYSQESSLSNLRISGFTPYSFNLSIGVKKGSVQLVSILNKSLELITANEKSTIYSNWVNQETPLIDYSLLWKIILVGIIIFILIFYWNRRLAHEIVLRKDAEKHAISASQAKSDFLANMSHEIRTPMNSVLGFAELLDAMIVDREQKSYIKSIRSSGVALMGIINDILDLSKIEAGKFVAKPAPTSLRQISGDMAELFKDRFLHQKITFTINYDDSFPDYIMIDGPRMRQILVNLIGNAVKFTNEGTIQLSISLDDYNRNSNTVDFSLSVRDTGVGIPEDQLKLIFDKFKQQDGQDISEYGGTGLGLAICEQLSKLLGGKISVQSQVGKGSDFTVYFSNIPVSEDTDSREMTEKKNLIVFDPAVVLVVDDIKDNRVLVMENFRNTNLVFQEASNGREALGILQEEKIDMVFLDLRMPIMNGYEAIEIIKRDESLSGIPIIALTASIMGKDLEKVGHYGFDGYLRKPVNHEDLITAMIPFLSYSEKPAAESEAILDFSEFSPSEVQLFTKIINSEFTPIWEDIKDKGDFSLIESFAESLYNSADRHNINPIKKYAEMLMDYAESFDIVMVEKLMAQFPDISAALFQLIRENNNE